MATKGDKTRRKVKESGVKKLRDQAIIQKALEGKKTQEIAAEVGVTRQTVSEVLNSEDVKKKVKEIDARLAAGIDDAIQTVLYSVKDNYDAAYDLLKNFGSMKTSVDINHSFPKPLVIKRKDGTEVVLGTTADRKDEDGN